MHIQGIRLKSGKIPQKGTLHEITEKSTIEFREKNSSETVDICFNPTVQQKAFYAEEYRPATIAREDANVIDITACIIDEGARGCNWYLYDVKKDVGGEDVIFHLCAQWQAGLKYLKNSVLNYLEDFQFEEHIGVMTRQFDELRIAKAVASRESRISQIEQLAPRSLAGRKMLTAKPKLEAEKKLLAEVYDRKFLYMENGVSTCYHFEVVILEEGKPGEYRGELTVEMA